MVIPLWPFWFHKTCELAKPQEVLFFFSKFGRGGVLDFVSCIYWKFVVLQIKCVSTIYSLESSFASSFLLAVFNCTRLADRRFSQAESPYAHCPGKVDNDTETKGIYYIYNMGPKCRYQQNPVQKCNVVAMTSHKISYCS